MRGAGKSRSSRTVRSRGSTAYDEGNDPSSTAIGRTGGGTACSRPGGMSTLDAGPDARSGGCHLLARLDRSSAPLRAVRC